MSSRLVPTVLWLLGSPIVFASNPGAPDDDAIVITAARVAQTVDATLQPVTVITRRDIERSQAQSLQDVLRGQPGVAISNHGGAGKATSLFLRGANSDHVLVMLDGQKIGSATTGTASFQDIPVELIERIEIVRGARSSLYGSEAIGGVIQIFTRKGDSGAALPTASIGAGSLGTVQGSATFAGSGADGAGWYSVGLSRHDTRGLDACKGSRSAGCFTVEPDKDGYRNHSTRLRAGWRLGKDATAEVNLLRAESRNDYDGSSVNQSMSVQQLIGATLAFSPAANWQSVLRAGQSRDDSDNFRNGIYKSRFNTRREGASWQNDLKLAEHHQLVAGIDWQRDRVDSTTRYAVMSRDDTGLFAQYLAQFGEHRLQLAARSDGNGQFGRKNTESIAWGRALGEDLRVTASWGAAFKAPTFNQLYYPGFGNAGLRPETSRGIDLGLAGKTRSGRWSLNAYATRVADLIGFDAAYNPVNIDTAQLRGIELAATIRLAEWALAGNLNFSDPRNQASDANHDKRLPRRARHAATFAADREFGPWRWGATLRGEGHRFDNLANTTRLGGHTTADMRTEYRLTPDWRLQARIENLFDKDYETAYLFNQAGRGVYLTLRYQPR